MDRRAYKEQRVRTTSTGSLLVLDCTLMGISGWFALHFTLYFAVSQVTISGFPGMFLRIASLVEWFSSHSDYFYYSTDCVLISIQQTLYTLTRKIWHVLSSDTDATYNICSFTKMSMSKSRSYDSSHTFQPYRMTRECVKIPSTPHIPNIDAAIQTACHQHHVVRMPLHANHSTVVL